MSMKHAAVAAAFVVPLALSPVLQAQESHLSEVRAQASQRFGRELTSIRQEVDHVDTARKQYEAGCHGKVTTIRPVYPEGIPLDRPLSADGALVSGIPRGTTGGSATPLRFEIRNETTAACRILRSDIIAGVSSVEHRLAAVSEDARKAGIYPGVMRDLRTSHGLPPLD